MIHKQKENQLTQTDLEITKMMELTDNDIKTVIINMHKDLKEDMNIKKTEVEDIFKNRISLTENIISEMENVLNGQIRHCSR